MSRVFFTILLLFSLVATAAESDNLKGTFLAFAEKVPTKNIEAAPALSNGRLKPLDSVAREITLFLSGKYKFWGLDATSFYLALAVFPDADLLKVIEVRDVGVRERLGLDSGRRHFSARELGETTLLAMA